MSEDTTADDRVLPDWFIHRRIQRGRYVVAHAIYPDGTSWPWLLDTHHHDDNPANGCAMTCCAPHEQPGVLPADVLERITPRRRCGAPRLDGEPCRAQVATPDGKCRWHQGPARQEALW